MVRFKNRYILFEVLWEHRKINGQLSVLPFVAPTSKSKTLTEVSSLKISYDADHEYLQITAQQLIPIIKEALLLNFGDVGCGILASSLAVKYYNPVTGVGILRASRDAFRIAWASLTYINAIKKKGCLVRGLHTGGTIRSCQVKAIKYSKLKLNRLKSIIESSKFEKIGLEAEDSHKELLKLES